MSRLSPDACLRVLKHQAAAHPVETACATRVDVSDTGHKFTVSTFTTGARPFYGVISPQGSGSRIKGRLGTKFWRLWTHFPQYLIALLLLALAGLAAAACSLVSRLSGHLWCAWSPVGAGTFLGLIGGLAAAAIAYLEFTGRGADASVVEWIERSLEATREEQD